MRQVVATMVLGSMLVASTCWSEGDLLPKKREPEPTKPASGTTAPAASPAAQGVRTSAPGALPPGLPTPPPSASPATDGDYPLAPKDQITVQVYGQDDMTRTVRIDQDGSITLPMIGKVPVGGLTVAEAQQKVEAAFKDGGYFLNPRVSIVVTEYQGSQYTVTGAVNQPGTYALRTRQTPLMSAISEARGVRENAEPSAYVVRAKPHPGETQPLQVDLVSLVKSGDKNSVMVEPGDIIYVPEENTFYVTGEVEKVGAYTLRRDTTLSKAITEAGGLGRKAAGERVTIVRTLPSGEKKEITPLNVEAIMKGDHQSDVKLQAQDVVMVPASGGKTVAYGILDFVKGIFSIGASVPVK